MCKNASAPFTWRYRSVMEASTTTDRQVAMLTAGCVVSAALSLRWVMLAALHGALHLLDMPFIPAEVDLGLLLSALTLVLGIPVAAASFRGLAWLRQRPGWSLGLAVGGVVVLSMVAANYARQLNGFYWHERMVGDSRGVYPQPADTEVRFSRCGETGIARINSDGYRVCEPADRPQTGEEVVTLVGDSFVFGLATPDDGSLCWALREDFDEIAPGRFEFRNLGQPGANLRSYERMFRFAHREFGTDRFIVGLLVPNDSMLHDVNEVRRSKEVLSFRVLAAMLEPYTVLAAAQMWDRVGRSEFFSYLSFTHGIRQLGKTADELGVPTLIFMYDSLEGYQARERGLAPFVERVEEVAAARDQVEFAGVLSITENVQQYMLCDGHPNSAGNHRHAEQLQPAIQAWMAP